MTHFAESLKLLRQQSALSMQALAEKAGVSKSMICKIERDEVQPTLDVAARLAKAFNKTLSEMLHTPQTMSVVFLPRNEQAIWEDAHHIKRRNISPVFEGLKIEWLQVEFPAGTFIQKCLPVTTHKIEKYVLVTKGILEIQVDTEIFLLKKGDSLYFEASCAHSFHNRGKETAEFYILVKHG